MNQVAIAYSKYDQLHTMIADPVLGILIGAFEEKFKCVPRIISQMGDGQMDSCVMLTFESERDLILFKLKYL